MTPIRTLNELDHVRIAKLLDAGNAAHAPLQALLDHADQLPPDQMPADLVTMRSRLRVSDANGGAPREISVVYPAEADAAQGRISVLSPLGQALLGLPVGALAQWTLPDGRTSALRVEALLFQPEAAGEYLR